MIIEPPESEWDSLRQPLTEGERRVLDSIIRAVRDMPGWEVYIQPALNGLRPDVVLMNPAVGIHVIEVKDGALSERPDLERLTNDSVGKMLRKLWSYQNEVSELYAPSLGERLHGKAAVSATLIFTNEEQRAVDEIVLPLARTIWLNSPQTLEYLRFAGVEAIESPTGLLVPQRKSSYLMSEQAAEEIRRWLREPHHSKAQRTPVNLDRDQRDVAETRTDTGYRKVRGPAGSGKSLCIAARAASLQKEGKDVLVVTFNMTLLNYLADLSVRFGGKRTGIVWLHFHGWCKRVMLEAGRKEEYDGLWRDVFDGDTQTTATEVLNDLLPQAAVDALNRIPEHERKRWDAIFVDEGQDFRLEWWNALRRQLRDGGEMVLAADRAQDVYATDARWTEQDSMRGSGLPGQWKQLSVTYRIPSELIQVLQTFLDTYLPDQPVSLQVPAGGTQLELAGPCRLRWVNVRDEKSLSSTMATEILDVLNFASEHGHDGAWSDVTFLSPSATIGAEVVATLNARKINVQHTFQSDHRVNRRAKLNFYQGSERVRGTTIHSYKGWESPLLVVGISRASTERDLALVYAALTRLLRSTEGSTLTVISSAPELRDWARSTWDEVAFV